MNRRNQDYGKRMWENIKYGTPLLIVVYLILKMMGK